jgi:hypothetical protein
MHKSLFLFLIILFLAKNLEAQKGGSPLPEIQVAYYGEFLFHPGAKVGISLPFWEWRTEKPQSSKRRGDYAIVKQKELRLGSNLSFYNIVRNHTGFLLNAELTYRRSKFYSFRPEKKGQLEFAFGMGYFRYRLHGTTFQPDGESFKEINGNGGAFMPSLSASYGGTFKYQGTHAARYYLKPIMLAEIPFGTALQVTTVLEAGIALPLGIKGFAVKNGGTKIKRKKKRKR